MKSYTLIVHVGSYVPEKYVYYSQSFIDQALKQFNSRRLVINHKTNTYEIHV